MKFSKREILILTGASLFQFAFIGILPNSLGIFLTEIKNTMGFSMVRISSFTGIKGIADAALAVPFSFMVFKLGYKKSMYISAFLVCLGYTLLTFTSATIIWYFIPVIISCTASVGAICVPYLLQKAFPQKGGTTSGIAMAFSGVGGMIFNIISSKLITLVGWKNCIYILSILTMLLVAIACRLIYSADDDLSLAELNKNIYSNKENPEDNKGQKVIASLTMCTVCILGACMCRQLIDYISLYVDSLEYSLEFAAVVSAFSMIGNFGGKFIFGILDDKIGFWRALSLLNLVIAIGSFGMVFFSFSKVLLCLFSMLFGLTFVGPSTGLSRCCIAMFGSEKSKRYSGILTTLSSIVRSLTGFAAGFIFDINGSFVLIFVLGACACILSSLASLRQKSISHAG